jgi:Zn-dependent alcohol dehydrogenase
VHAKWKTTTSSCRIALGFGSTKRWSGSGETTDLKLERQRAGTDNEGGSRLPLGRRCGETRTVNAQREDLLAIVSEMTEGRGADLVIEASGLPRAARDIFHLVGRGKVVAAIGLTGRELNLD